MSHLRRLAVVSAVALWTATSCGVAPSSRADPGSPERTFANPPAPSSAGVAPADGVPSRADVRPALSEPRARDVVVEVRLPSKETCKLVFRGFDERPEGALEGRYITGIERIASEPGGCADGVLFDGASERGSPAPAESLFGGEVRLGHLPGLPSSFPGVHIADMSFDGHLDLCVSAGMGTLIGPHALEQSRRCWLYEPASRTFVESPDLASLQWPVFHTASRTIEAGVKVLDPRYQASRRAWVGPRSFSHGRYQWNGGKLETLELMVVRLDDGPDGKPVPSGSYWAQRHLSIRGVLTKVFEGTVAY